MSVDQKPLLTPSTTTSNPFTKELSDPMPDGSIFKRCGCRDTHTGKPLGNHCPKLRRANRAWSSDHGHWHYQLELPLTPEGRRRQLRRGGFDTRANAATELDQARALLALAKRDRNRRVDIGDMLQHVARTRRPLPDPDDIRHRLRAGGPLTDAPTVAQHLTTWLTGLQIDENTTRGYESHVHKHLIPHLGDIPLDKLRPRHIKDMFAAIEARNTEIETARTSPDPAIRATVRGIRPCGPATRQRIRGTLRKAINDALAEEIIAGVTNPATLVKTPGDRPHPIIWEPERVDHWKTTSQIPGPVMVWTDELLARFLDHAAEHDPDLHPLYHFMAYRGARRGEACGLRDSEVRLTKQEVTINNQIAVHGHTTRQKAPKSKAGNRDLTLDADTTAILTTYRARRAAQRLQAGTAWPDTGLFFVRPNGHPWHPNLVTNRFRKLIHRAELPPIRLHDLRHGAATIALDAGIDIKVVSEQLGHTTTTLTRDTYQSVTKELHHNAADAVAERIKKKRHKSA
ncbi:tyrosine-type recombinase/integrase [Verrucosispora sp. TAA-831]|uniref:tyrosine-type recombinase/integrase n=1 Tax=Verrucosispora sp. TAA-831 TaxID=3422227 RepID=UPI003D6E29F1